MLLIVARFILKILPFRRVTKLVALKSLYPSRDPAAICAAARDVGRAIRSATRALPGGGTCFVQGIAAQIMMRRRHIPAVLYYGVARDEGGALIAHVWVRAAGEPVVGCAIAQNFAVLTCFPAENGAPLAATARVP